jgi:multiple sugar transport system substrate-binding protein
MRRKAGHRLVIAFAVMAATTLAGCADGSKESNSGNVELELMTWSYSADVVQDNLRKFEQLNPGITVSVKEVAWASYHDAVVADFAAGGKPADVLYASDEWVQEWGSAEWIAPVDDLLGASKVEDYRKDWAPFARDALTFQNKTYGLPFYADVVGFVYNEKLLAAAGIKELPGTWDDVLTAARALKAKGLDYPIGIGLSQSDGFSSEYLEAMVASRGGTLFDRQLNPQLEGSALGQSLQWVKDGLDQGLINPEALVTDMNTSIKAVSAGAHAFTIARASALATFNNPQSSPHAGNFKLLPMPGSTHQTTGYVRFYATSRAAIERGKDVAAAAAKLVEYLGGKTDGEYVVVKRWTVEKGLGFAQTSLFDDKDVQGSIEKWGDFAALKDQYTNSVGKTGLAPWYGEWATFGRSKTQDAYLGKASVSSVQKELTDSWNDLRAKK